MENYNKDWKDPARDVRPSSNDTRWMEKPRKVTSRGKHPCVEWDGRRWYKTQCYYIDRTGKLLHREIYQSAYGPIPKGFHVHHINEDQGCNDLENLEALPVAEHFAKHPERGFMQNFDPRIGARALWANKKPKEFFCAECGTRFESTCTRARLCSKPCADRHYYKRRKSKS